MSFDAASYVMGIAKGTKDGANTIIVDGKNFIVVHDGHGNITFQPVDDTEAEGGEK